MQSRLHALVVWAVALACVAICGTIASVLVLMPVSLDPTEMIEAGTDPWATALDAGLAFLGLLVTAVAGLALWHRPHLRWLGLVLVAAVVVATGWSCVWVAREYF